MIQLLRNYSLEQVLILIVFAAIAFKQLITFFDWAIDKLRKKFKKQQQPESISLKLNSAIEQQDKEIIELKEDVQNIQTSIERLEKNIAMLISSDRDAIKAWITAQHHHFIEKGGIDYYSLDCIAKRYEHYKDEGGNSFVDDIMEELNSLPKTGSKKHIKDI